VSAALWRRSGLRGTLLLTPPLLWLILVFLVPLVVLLITAFWRINDFTIKIEHVWNLNNVRTVFGNGTYRAITLRTIGMASLVTITDAILAFPVAYFMARVATRRTQTVLFVAILLPLWASYLARVYAWILILSHDGTLNWILGRLGIGGTNLAYTNTAMWIVFSYVWLPFMLIPVYTALERIPASYLEASSDLGGREWRTLRSVILPLALPGLVAGSIFTFALTLGDYITPILVGGAGSSMVGNVIYSNFGTAGNVPLAAAFALVPIIVMAVYLFLAKRLGAFEAL
jgi:putative spermidine/putrescine transport system permease protein